MGKGSFPGVKRAGHGVDHPPPSGAEVKERVELYLYSPFGPSWPVLGWSLPLPYIYIYIHTYTYIHIHTYIYIHTVSFLPKSVVRKHKLKRNWRFILNLPTYCLRHLCTQLHTASLETLESCFSKQGIQHKNCLLRQEWEKPGHHGDKILYSGAHDLWVLGMELASLSSIWSLRILGWLIYFVENLCTIALRYYLLCHQAHLQNSIS